MLRIWIRISLDPQDFRFLYPDPQKYADPLIWIRIHFFPVGVHDPDPHQTEWILTIDFKHTNFQTFMKNLT